MQLCLKEREVPQKVKDGKIVSLFNIWMNEMTATTTVNFPAEHCRKGFRQSCTHKTTTIG